MRRLAGALRIGLQAGAGKVYMSSENSEPQNGEEDLPKRHEAQDADAGYEEEQDEPVGGEDPDVTLNIPRIGVEELGLKVSDVRARISLQAELAEVVQINVGVDAQLEDVELDLKGLEAQALLKANLDNVRVILGKTLEAMGQNPELFENLVREADDSGGGLEGVAGEIQDSDEEQDQAEDSSEDQT